MKKIFIALVAIITTSAFQPVVAQKQVAPPGGTPKDFKLPAKKTNTYKNGLKTTLVQYGNIPKVNISLIVKTGNVHEATNQIWLANLTANLLREGTQKMNFAAISKKAAMMGSTLTI